VASVPDGVQVSDDGQYWWDGAQWQLIPADGLQFSDDRQYWWDGSQWQPMSAQGQVDSPDTRSAGAGTETTFDIPQVSDYPTISALAEYSDGDTYLSDLGVDLSKFDDEGGTAYA
jgi:hypothetical protein